MACFDDGNDESLRDVKNRMGNVVKNTGKAVAKIRYFFNCGYHSELVGKCSRGREGVKFDDNVKSMQPKLPIMGGTTSLDKSGTKDVF